MGMESDQEIVQMVGRDPRFSASLLPSMEASIMATYFCFHVIFFNLWVLLSLDLWKFIFIPWKAYLISGVY